ncbi:MAG: hypothetical protein IJE89_03485 [Bacilli bacterium]|nr:hypothetical protein [Bacilli bacterium]
MDANVILENIINFLFVALIFLGVLAVTFKITLKNYNVKTGKLKFYGLFLGMDNKSILAFGSITLNYIFLIWCTATFSGMNIFYILITTIFVVLSDILIKDYRRIPIDLLFTLINCVCMFVISLIYDYLVNEYTTIFLLIVLGLVIIFVFLYFTYITFKWLNNIVLKQEHLQKKNYKKL